MTYSSNVPRLGKTRKRRSSVGAVDDQLSSNQNRRRNLMGDAEEAGRSLTTDDLPLRNDDDGGGQDDDGDDAPVINLPAPNRVAADDIAINGNGVNGNVVNVNAVSVNAPNPNIGRVRRRRAASTVVRRLEPAEVRSQMIAPVINRVTQELSDTYRNLNAPTPNLRDWQTIDPFGTLAQDPYPNSPLANYNYGGLTADKGAAFLQGISMTGNLPADLNDLRGDRLAQGQLSSGIPPLQHSIWVGNPLDANNPKQQRFMDALARNKRENPNWTVVLWTDQSRANLANANDTTDVGRKRLAMVRWARENGIVLANIDEVFSGNNQMTLQTASNYERLRGGPGRAAASDITRLEVINRFGGFYVDGDKPVWNADSVAGFVRQKNNNGDTATLNTQNAQVGVNNVDVEYTEIVDTATNFRGTPLDYIARQAQQNTGTFRTNDADGNALNEVPVNGIAVGSDNGAFQNCALCASKGNRFIQRTLSNIQNNYAQNRTELRIPSARAARTEVIRRTGPSTIKQALKVNPDDQSFGADTQYLFIPEQSVNVASGGKSWTGEEKFNALRDPRQYTRVQVNNNDLLADLERTARNAFNNVQIPRLPTLNANDANYDTTVTAIANAVEESLTILHYTIPNDSNNTLDLNLLKKPLANLTPAQQQLAFHSIIEALGQPQFTGLRNQIQLLRLPTPDTNNLNNFQLARETLDLLRTSDNFAQLDLTDYTIQDAVVSGNLPFIKYAQENDLLADLTKESTKVIEMGTASRNDRQIFADPNIADLETFDLGTSQFPKFLNNSKINLLEAALKSRLQNPNTLHYLSALGLLDNLPNFDWTEMLQEAADLRQLDTAIALSLKYDRPQTIPNVIQAAPKSLRFDIFERYYNHFTINGARNLGLDGNTRSRILESAVITTLGQAANPGQGFTNLTTMFRQMENRGFLNIATLSPTNKQRIFDAILDQVTNRNGADEALTLAGTFGFLDEFLIRAGQTTKATLISESINRKRLQLGIRTVDGNTLDPDANLAIAYMNVPDAEASKNDYVAYQNDNDGYEVGNMTEAEALVLSQKALMYAHARLRANTSGKTSRMQGWVDLLTTIRNREQFPKANSFIAQARGLLRELINNDGDRLRVLRAEANVNLSALPLPNQQVLIADDELGPPVYVPGKGMVQINNEPTLDL